MSFIKGKQIKDNSLDLDKIKGGSKVLPNTATLGSAKTVAEITSANEFTTKEFVDTAVTTKSLFERIDTSGKVTYGTSLQELIDTAPTGSTIILHSSLWRSNNIIHKNAVNIDLNSFDLPRLYDSSSSGKFRIYGKGRVGKVFFSQSTTDVEIHSEINNFAADNSLLYEGVDYMTVNCKRFVLFGELINKFQSILMVSGATNLELHGGGYVVKRSANKPAGISSNMYVEYGNSPMVEFSNYTGEAYITGTWHSNTGNGVINIASSTGAANITFDQITLTNFAPYPVVGGSGYPQGIVSTSTTVKLVFRGTCNLNAPSWLDLSVTASAPVEVEGEIICPQGLNNSGNIIYKSPLRIASTGAVRDLGDATNITFSLNKGKHGLSTLGTATTDRTLTINHAQSIDNFNYKILNCAGQKLYFAGITGASYYIFGSMNQITHITLPSSGFAIIEFYKHGNDVFIKSDVTTKQYIDSAQLVNQVVEVSGGTATGTGIKPYTGTITFSGSAPKTPATVTVNGVQVKIVEDAFFSSDGGVTKKDRPSAGDTLYFDLTTLLYEIESDDEIVINYFV
jgi:hypothetical protein